MITAYLMICSFVLGGYVCAALEREERLPIADWVLIAFLSAAWPVLVPILAIHVWSSHRTKQ